MTFLQGPEILKLRHCVFWVTRVCLSHCQNLYHTAAHYYEGFSQFLLTNIVRNFKDLQKRK